MKASLGWLREYIDLPPQATVAEIAKKLTFSGLEIEGVKESGKGFEKIFVGQILERNQHPNADRLSLCKVTVGNALTASGDILEIVCGAQNIKAGDKIPVATLGAIIPNGLEIKAAKIRGVPSSGMLCSADEMLLQKPAAQKEDGIYILPADAPLGKNFAEYLGLNDTVLEINITPNRGDCLSHMGVARELAALFAAELKWPEIPAEISQAIESAKKKSEIKIANEVGENCPAYYGAYLQGVKIGPSPDWLKKNLELLGVRSINNVVDITTFVMLEMGQPLHAFDAAKLPGGHSRMDIRFGQENEKFSTISHKEISLTKEDLVISSGGKAVALAGVMGSDNSEVDETTRDIFLEAAEFSSKRVRKTSRKNQLITDASYRFERGIDSERVEWAMGRAIALIQKVAGGELKMVGGSVAEKQPAMQVRLRLAEVQKLLGKSPDSNTICGLLRSLGFGAEVAAGEAGVLEVKIPAWRKDCSRSVDIVEEIARIWGFDHLEAKLPLGTVADDSGQRNFYFQIRRLRRHLTSLGFSEALNLGFTSKAELGKTLHDSEMQRLVEILNPLTVDFSVMKPTLITGLLANIEHNFSHQQKNVRLFEVRKTFNYVNVNEPKRDAAADARLDTGIEEKLKLGMVLTGAEIDQFWQGQEPVANFYTLKGVVDSFLQMLGRGGVEYFSDGLPSYIHPGQGAVLRVGKRNLGYLGRLHPRVEKNLGFSQAVYVAEFLLENILHTEIPQASYKAFGKFPVVQRDFSATVGEQVQAAQIRSLVAKLSRPLFQDIQFFDVYRGSRIPAGHTSYAFRIFLGAPDRTLTDLEVNELQNKIMQTMSAELGAKFAGM